MSKTNQVGILPLSRASHIASYSIQIPKHPEIELAQAEHRIHLVNTWGVQPGSRILEIGCGQGTCTAVLAEAVGPDGHVDGVDPAPGDYGAPFTLDQAQEFLGASAVGSRISWHRDDPTRFLSETETKWDAAVLAHSIWYFAEPEVLNSILKALKGRVDRVYVAEYALHATKETAVPHVLSAMTRATLEAHKTESTENIRTLLSPGEIKEMAGTVGWSVEKEETIVPGEGLLDGCWEASTTGSSEFLGEVEADIKDARVISLLRSGRDAVAAAAGSIGGMKKVTTMDVWAVVLYKK